MVLSRLASFSVPACRTDAPVVSSIDHMVSSDQACVSAADSSFVWATPIRSVGDIAGGGDKLQRPSLCSQAAEKHFTRYA